MEEQKVVFVNKDLNLRLAGVLRLPDHFDLSKDYPALVVTGPMLSVKEGAQKGYAQKLTEMVMSHLLMMAFILARAKACRASRNCLT